MDHSGGRWVAVWAEKVTVFDSVTVCIRNSSIRQFTPPEAEMVSGIYEPAEQG